MGFLFCAASTLAQDKKPDNSSLAPISIAKIKRTTSVDFDQEILTILKNNCLACHNKTTSKANLVLETPQDILRGGDSGPAIVPKRGDASLLLKAASHQLEDTVMPPRSNKVQASDLTPEELGLIKLWIDQGAKSSVGIAKPIEWQPLPEGLNSIYAVALTSDGQFAACGRGNQIFIYHVPSAQLVGRLTDPQLRAVYGKAGAAHRDLVHALAFSPDGNLLASGGYREVKLWRRPQNVTRLNLTSVARKVVQTMTVSPDGKWLATGSADGSVKLWNLATGKLEKNLPNQKGAINTLRFSPDGASLAAGSADRSISVWKFPGAKLFARVETAAEVNAVTWIAGGKQIASGGADHVIRIWYVDVVKQELAALKEIKGHTGPVTSLDTVPSAPMQIISGSGDGSLRQWNLEDGQVVRQMKHGGPISSVAVRADGKRFASAGLDNVAKLWDAENGKLIAELKGDRYVRELAADKERDTIFTTAEVDYRKTALKSAETNHVAQAERVKKATDAFATAEKAFAEKQKGVKDATDAKATADKTLAELTEALTKLAQTSEAGENPAKSAETAAVQKSKAENKTAADKQAAEAKEKQKQAKDKVNAATKTLADAEAALKKAELGKSTSEHELQLATAAEQKTASALAEAKAALQTSEEEQKKAETGLQSAKKASVESEAPIRAIAFSPDNLTLATAGDDQEVHTWSAEKGAPFEIYKGHKGAVFAVAFAGNSQVVSGGMDRSTVVWELNGGWTLERMIGSGDASSPLIDRVNALRFSADGQLLATGGGEPTRGGEIKLWQTATGKLAQSFTNVHSDAVFGLDFSPDGKYLASSAADKFVKVVELSSGKVVKSFEGHTHHVLGVSWKRDGRTLASAGADNMIKVWDFLGGERRKNIEGFGKEVTSIKFVGITDQALVSSGDSQVRLVTEKGDKIRAFDGAADFIYSTAVTPDGKTVVAGGQDGVLRVWNGMSGEVLATFAPPVNK